MKRLAVAVIAAITMAAPLAIATPAAAHPQHYSRGHDDYDRHDRRYDRGHDRRHDRRHDRWDHRRYNGYYYRGAWHYGPPPSRYGDVRYGYRDWRRGDRLPRYYRDHYVVVNDYRRHRLAPPPRGYHYVRDDRGDYLLVGIATGVILGAILAN